jgi:hypothetical protein
MVIRPVHASPEAVGEKAQGKRIARMQLQLEIWLLAVGGERSLADHESHNVPDIEFPHASS